MEKQSTKLDCEFEFSKIMQTSYKQIVPEKRFSSIIKFDTIDALNKAWVAGDLKNSYTVLQSQQNKQPQTKVSKTDKENEFQYEFDLIESINLFKSAIKPFLSDQQNQNTQILQYNLTKLNLETAKKLWFEVATIFVSQEQSFSNSINGIVMKQTTTHLEKQQDHQEIHLQIWFKAASNLQDIIEAVKQFNQKLSDKESSSKIELIKTTNSFKEQAWTYDCEKKIFI